jgi:hypothetical protein
MALVLLTELVGALAFSATALWHERESRLRAFDVMLQGRSDSLLGAVQDAEDAEDNVAIDPTELRVPADDVWAVYNRGGRLLGSSDGAPAELIARHGDGVRAAAADGRDYRVRQSDGVRIRCAAVGAGDEGAAAAGGGSGGDDCETEGCAGCAAPVCERCGA